jgi:hypothetical protein
MRLNSLSYTQKISGREIPNKAEVLRNSYRSEWTAHELKAKAALLGRRGDGTNRQMLSLDARFLVPIKYEVE